jgi:hypothetical protein
LKVKSDHPQPLLKNRRGAKNKTQYKTKKIKPNYPVPGWSFKLPLL